MPASSLSLGLIGAGRIGQLHAEHLRCRLPRANLLAVADPNEKAARSCAERLGIPDCGTDPAALIRRPDLEAVVICSSTDTHPQLIAEAAAAGKHIFCEKPVAANLADIDRALAAVDRAGVLFQVGFNRRFDPNFQRARQAVASGEIGTPHQLRITSRYPAPPPL